MTEQKILRDIEILENQVLITQCTRLKGAWLDKKLVEGIQDGDWFSIHYEASW